MEDAALLAISLFLTVYALIIWERIHRTIVALIGAALMVALGILDQSRAIHHVDFNTIGLLVGMMVMVNITAETGLFRFLSVWMAKRVQGDPIRLFIGLGALTAVCSALLDNVTTVLLTVPVTISLCHQLKLKPIPFLMAQIILSNIGGTATLIGDPPNIMIGSAVRELDFLAFINNLALVSAFIFVVTTAILVVLYRRDLKTTPELRAKICGLDAARQIHDPKLLKKCLFVLAMTILLFAAHRALHLESATVAIFGASLLLLLSAHNTESRLEHAFQKVEWVAVFFFVGLFVLVGGLVETGVIRYLAGQAMHVTSGDPAAAAMLVLWLSAIASAFIDNIPFVATMIPLIKELGTLGMTSLEPLWWSLALGACLGGNGTIVGASANVIVIGLAAQEGYRISFLQFLKVGFPLMILSVLIASAYVYWRYLS